MGSTIVTALIDAGWPGAAVTVANRTPAAPAALNAKYGVVVAGTAADAVANADIVVVAVKPQDTAELLDSIRDAIHPGVLLLTVAAALPSSFYAERLGMPVAVVRAMPNTPAVIGRGATAIAAGVGASDAHLHLVSAMLRTTGLVVTVEEDQLEAVIAVAGSAPAYFYAFVEALTNAGVAQGLDRILATQLATQTFIGAAALLAESGETPQTLRSRVSSKGGTTLAALEAMDHAGLKDVVSAGANAAVHRSRELRSELAP